MLTLRPYDVRLRWWREHAGLALCDLARETGLGLDALRRLERGVGTPLVTTALLLAEALGVEVEDLFGDPNRVD